MSLQPDHDHVLVVKERGAYNWAMFRPDSNDPADSSGVTYATPEAAAEAARVVYPDMPYYLSADGRFAPMP